VDLKLYEFILIVKINSSPTRFSFRKDTTAFSSVSTSLMVSYILN